MTEIQTVTDFLSALEALDVDRALTHAAPGMVYQNVPLPPARGLPAVEKTLRSMTRYGTGFEARVHNIAANGPVVLTERTDVLECKAWRAEFWVCGTFEVHDDRITLWRDYFDWTTFLAASAKGLGGVLRAALASRPHRRPAPR
ncbi:nuclear transport factor 2 family protein [Actinomadura sp. NAK00032]|uniref:limonene-1,2-epoxide hydrolase family protein n=1 Tax=Actinomadura sp. NAK00032 TaxID=2742128 RepID=UPI001592A9F8|nr:limonene-1,2-epoxide hydrolase family protein [Actinomadura sp. NAK00032]QKW37322.1 nuclear transport factor 2 family protein [Actinomadura sp. NAK00032]